MPSGPPAPQTVAPLLAELATLRGRIGEHERIGRALWLSGQVPSP